MNEPLTFNIFTSELVAFSKTIKESNFSSLYGVTDGKAVGTFIEHKLKEYLSSKYTFKAGNSASGIDFPELNIDIKVTSIRQPQSSCPFKSARQKIFGLGYDLVVFVYDKFDNEITRTANLDIIHVIHINKNQTADYQTTYGLIRIIQNDGNIDDIISFLFERNLPIDEIEATSIAEEVLINLPLQGYLTISNALQWRLQYSRVIQVAGNVNGVTRFS